jgi:glycosyltransferase involved in cell wall biosynthesis
VLIEAAAAGVPIIATNVGGVSEIMTPFAFALVPSENADALADAIETRMEEPSSLRSFTTGVIQNHIRENLSVRRMAEDVERSYRDAMQRRGLT